MAWLLKGCPRCGGDLQYDSLESLWDCVACGWLSVPIALAYPVPAERHRRRTRTAGPRVAVGCSADGPCGASEGKSETARLSSGA